MKIAEIRSKLHHFIEHDDDKKVKALYVLLEKSIQSSEHYSPEFEAELDRRYEEYKTDSQEISLEDMNKRGKETLSK